jgi:hypothetical protein
LALVTSAWVEAGRAKGLFDEAQAAADSMPPDARTLRYSRWVASLIAGARRSLRQGPFAQWAGVTAGVSGLGVPKWFRLATWRGEWRPRVVATGSPASAPGDSRPV